MIECEYCIFKKECEEMHGAEREDYDDYRAVRGTHYCKLSWLPFYIHSLTNMVTTA